MAVIWVGLWTAPPPVTLESRKGGKLATAGAVPSSILFVYFSPTCTHITRKLSKV